MMSEYHVPVLLHESIDGLAIKPDGVYVDATFGGGGHSSEILKQLNGGRLFGFDQDTDALRNLPDNPHFQFVNANFRHIKHFMRYYGITQVDGILADLGVSSHHLNEATRGFAFRYSGPLDMRMNTQAELTAAKLLNVYEEQDMLRIFRQYGEIDNASCLVRQIVAHRAYNQFDSIEEFLEVIDRCVDKRQENKYLAKVFQALRIEVNKEIGVLEEFLDRALELLKPGGRLVIITYHSLEDRLVKQFIKNSTKGSATEIDVYGRRNQSLKAVNKKVIVATDEEIAINNRARSAKLRIAEKV